MAKFIYIGPAPDTTTFGITFPKGELVEVEDKHAAAKLTNNPCFVDGDDVKKQTPVAELLPLIASVKTLEELAVFEADEERKTVLAVIAKKKAELA